MSDDKSRAALTIAALGVVFGDLGTSPLYTLQECVAGDHGVEPSEANLLGVLSLILWSLILVVTVKYLAVLMRADNRGEGGILALLALISPQRRAPAVGKIGTVALLALAGSALLFGDGIITPAISVLSAVEGLGTVTHAFDPYIVPASALILLGLFAIQRFGTGGLGRWFGPVMLVWFVVAGALGAKELVKHLEILAALSPLRGASFLATHGFVGFRLLGGVVLAVTGGEALYADMGHFGREPIRRAWLFICLPALMLSYLGQGAVLLDHPELRSAPFYAMCPDGVLRYPFVILAAAATVIASQALISGVFSLTHQAIRLGYFPRLTVRHTSDEVEGQTYLPLMNGLLAAGCIALVLVFQASAKLAAAFGLAVSGTMAITSLIFYRVTRERWGWSFPKALGLLVFFLTFDLGFTAANLLKLFDGGFIPLAVGAGFLAVMVTWAIGRSYLGAHFARVAVPFDAFAAGLEARLIGRIPGIAVYMASRADSAPPALVGSVERFRVAHETCVLLSVVTTETPHVPERERMTTETLGGGFHRVVLRYGFFETTNIPAALDTALSKLGLPPGEPPLYVLGRESFVASDRGHMGARMETLFAFLSRNSRSMTDYFQLPAERVLEIGSRVDL
jgi:KUP system potassium uptake protein